VRRYFAPALLLAASAACGTRTDKAAAQFKLSSSAFQNEGKIPAEFTCDAGGKSPPLSWSEPPPGTTSFALVVDDPDAPSGIFRHWGVWDIPASTRMIASGQAPGPQSTNDFGEPAYGAPCPPNGSHRYRFKLFALDTEKLGVSPGAKIQDVEGAAEKHVLGRAELVGTYQRH
jgi:Raf kinase inhibitor-like YbhB/YbcL family protein